MVGVVLAVVVVVVVAAIVLAACSTQQRRKRSGQTCGVPVVALSVADDSSMALIRNPDVVTYDDAKKLISSGNEASSVQYDYARPTDIAPGVMGHETSAHDAVLLTPMYEPMSDTPPAKVSMNTHSCAMTIQLDTNRCVYLNGAVLSCPLSLLLYPSLLKLKQLSFQIHCTACVISTTMCVSSITWTIPRVGNIRTGVYTRLCMDSLMVIVLNFSLFAPQLDVD